MSLPAPSLATRGEEPGLQTSSPAPWLDPDVTDVIGYAMSRISGDSCIFQTIMPPVRYVRLERLGGVLRVVVQGEASVCDSIRWSDLMYPGGPGPLASWATSTPHQPK